jgi:hypothetical protein
VPAVGLEPLGGVVAEGDLGLAVDRDVVVVVDVDQATEAQVPGQRGGLVAEAFRQVAVGADGEDAVIAHVGPEPGPQVRLGDGHAHAVGEALAERARGHLDAGRMAVLGVARCPGPPLPEVLDVVEAQAVPRQVQGGVEQHRGVAGGEDEPVSVGPVGRGGVVTHDARVEDMGQWG